MLKFHNAPLELSVLVLTFHWLVGGYDIGVLAKEEGRNPKGGSPTYYLTKLSWKLREYKENFTMKIRQ